MTDRQELIDLLDNYLHAYPETVFPDPPEERRAKDSAAAQVMRLMALPMFQRCKDALEADADRAGHLFTASVFPRIDPAHPDNPGVDVLVVRRT